MEAIVARAHSRDDSAESPMREAFSSLRASFAEYRERDELMFWSAKLEESSRMEQARSRGVMDATVAKLRKLERTCDSAGAKRVREDRQLVADISRKFGDAPFSGASATDVWSKAEEGAASRAYKRAVQTLSNEFDQSAKAYQAEVKTKMAALLKRQEALKKKASAKVGVGKEVSPSIAAAPVPPVSAPAPTPAPALATTLTPAPLNKSSTTPQTAAAPALKSTRKALVQRAWDLRVARANRETEVKAFLEIKRYRKSINQARVHINNAAGTIKDVRFRFIGETRNMGIKQLLDTVSEKLPSQLDIVQHVVADQFVMKASTQSSPEAIRHGESNFALAYLALAVMLDRPSFADHLMSSLVAACPYCVPGLRERIESDKLAPKARRSALGYKENESENDYLLRMQATVAWYGAILQTAPMMLAQPPYSMLQAQSGTPLKHPWGGIPECWRWIAGSINGVKWRWTRSLLQAFLAVAGSRIGLAFPNQSKKLVRFLATSRAFKTACDKGCSFPNDADRVAVFTKFVKGIFDVVSAGGNIPVPGNPEDKDHDARLLPGDVIENRG